MHGLEKWLLPPRCVLTAEPAENWDLSDAVQAGWRRPKQVCPQCGEWSRDATVCGACRVQPPAFDRTRVAYYFADELVELVHGLKYQGQMAYGRLLGEILASQLGESDVEGLVAVPLHPQRRRERGYNQAQLIAESLSKIVACPVLKGGVKRIRSTPSQTGLSARQRRANLKRAFQVAPNGLSGVRRIALVDDVITTGATMEALASTIKRHTSVDYIEAWAVAKTAR